MPFLLTQPSWGEPVPALRLFAIAAASLSLAVSVLAVKGWRLRRHLASIPVRIHVAGTRGKSTTTRLITEIFRAQGLRVFGKTTGSEPRLLLPDGSERPFVRCGRASVREQERLMSIAARSGADAVVVECMAIRPEMLWASEELLVRATTLVVTNARPDHLEELGSDPKASAEAFRWVIPQAGKVVATQEALTDGFRAAVAKAGAALTVVSTEGLGPGDANREVALAVAALHGIGRNEARSAMEFAKHDPGHFSERVLTIAGKTIRFANAFACNDVGSLAQLWSERTASNRRVVILNARSDRPMRTKHFLDFLSRQRPAPYLFIAGDSLACALARKAGFDKASIRWLPSTGREALTDVADAAETGDTVWCIGNYNGFGADLTAALAEASSPC